jgi:predicted MPP superfamily phosphohydrolase
MLIFMSAGCFYIGRRLIWGFPRLRTKKVYVYVSLGLFVAIQALGPLWYRLSPWAAQRPFVLQWLTYVSMGFMASLFFYYLAAELLVFIVKKIPLFFSSTDQIENLERRLFLGISFFSVATAAAGTKTALDGPTIETVEIPLKNLPAEFTGFSIVQISDLHVGPTINRDYAQKVVELTQSLHPDLIVMTGDMIDGFPEELRPHLEPLKSLHAPHGIFYCTGNHEYYWGGQQWCDEFRNMGFTVLLNESRLVTKGSANICVGGVTDLRAEQFIPEHKPDALKTFAGIPKETIKILLAHQPGAYPQSLDAGVHLQLSGHTHGGQFFPWSIFVAITHKFYRGLYFYKDLWVYTNRGTGYWGPPQRFSVPPEITYIRLTRGA